MIRDLYAPGMNEPEDEPTDDTADLLLAACEEVAAELETVDEQTNLPALAARLRAAVAVARGES